MDVSPWMEWISGWGAQIHKYKYDGKDVEDD